MTTPSAEPPPFQFRVTTLLALIAWAGTICIGLRTPMRLWSGLIGLLTLLIVLTAVIVAIYRRRAQRAMAVGFVLFCVGYLTYMGLLSGSLSSGLESDWIPIGSAFGAIFEKIHLDDVSHLNGINSPYYVNRTEFITVCNYATASVLGIVGAAVAQALYATRPRNEFSN